MTRETVAVAQPAETVSFRVTIGPYRDRDRLGQGKNWVTPPLVAVLSGQRTCSLPVVGSEFRHRGDRFLSHNSPRDRRQWVPRTTFGSLLCLCELEMRFRHLLDFDVQTVNLDPRLLSDAVDPRVGGLSLTRARVSKLHQSRTEVVDARLKLGNTVSVGFGLAVRGLSKLVLGRLLRGEVEPVFFASAVGDDQSCLDLFELRLEFGHRVRHLGFVGLDIQSLLVALFSP